MPPPPPAPLCSYLRHPPRIFGPIPFWSWNDDLDGDRLERQLHAFEAAGCGGVVLHARVGLSRRVAYLIDVFLGLVSRAVEAAAALGMKVVLYDEASYPSGSPCGGVAANPDYVSRSIGLWDKEIEGQSVVDGDRTRAVRYATVTW